MCVWPEPDEQCCGWTWTCGSVVSGLESWFCPLCLSSSVLNLRMPVVKPAGAVTPYTKGLVSFSCCSVRPFWVHYMFFAPGTGLMWMGATGLRLVSLIMYIFYIPLLRNVLHLNVNDSMIIKDNISLGDEGVANVSAKR